MGRLKNTFPKTFQRPGRARTVNSSQSNQGGEDRCGNEKFDKGKKRVKSFGSSPGAVVVNGTDGQSSFL